jgi:hypothetical protein
VTTATSTATATATAANNAAAATSLITYALRSFDGAAARTAIGALQRYGVAHEALPIIVLPRSLEKPASVFMYVHAGTSLSQLLPKTASKVSCVGMVDCEGWERAGRGLGEAVPF